MGSPSIGVLDTHTWIWWNEGDRRLSATARDAIERFDVLAVPAISVWELALLVQKGRITLREGLDEWVAAALSRPRVGVAELTVEVALRAARLGREFHRDPADRLIVATALELPGRLVTVDSQIRAFAGVETVW